MADVAAIKQEMMEHGFTLSNGLKLPAVAFGTWQSADGLEASSSVTCALQNGYTHIDCAAIYGNEQSVGEGIRNAHLKREEYFVTSKVWNTERGAKSTVEACKKSLKDLGLDYLDLYLIHWPAHANKFDNWDELNLSSWEGMIELYEAGLVKAIGVSNFLPHHLKSLLKTKIKPMVNQLEFHPGYIQPEAVKFSKEQGLVVEAWSPLGSGKVFTNTVLLKIAQEKNVTVQQVCLRYCFQHKTLVIPKSVHPERIIANLDFLSFELSDEEMAIIDALNDHSIGFSGSHPNMIAFA